MTDRTGPPFKLNNSELWGGVVGLALGIFVIWSSFRLKIGSIHDPGSGYVLFYTGILMCLFAVTIIIAAVTEGGPTFASRWEGTRWTRPAILIGCLVVYCFALGPLGFLLASIPLLLLLLRRIDPVRWPLALPLAVLAPLGVWWVLKHALLIQLPVGIFEIG
ncbi:tripartite tricarboxylate transporter TctB family protein [uncultured Bradyrhizobium sp.]|uniref:tripartite tricarboxylate transporter TctB family protein n=1 Tax=uncultured Bradyrhizobium sp. TaxID=199684 RepID=UPI0035CAA2CB